MSGPNGAPALPIHQLAHDLRQPLRGIVMTAQKMRRAVGPDSEACAQLETILRAAARQDGLLNAAVEFESAADTPEERNLPLALAVQTACMKVEAFRREQEGTITVSLPADLTAEISYACVSALEKVLHNALKFHAADVRPEVCIAATRDENGRPILHVSDNGIGIDPEYRDRVFVPFFRLHPWTDFPGSGLGLATARRWMEAVGGSLTLARAPLTGAEFVLCCGGAP